MYFSIWDSNIYFFFNIILLSKGFYWKRNMKLHPKIPIFLYNFCLYFKCKFLMVWHTCFTIKNVAKQELPFSKHGVTSGIRFDLGCAAWASDRNSDYIVSFGTKSITYQNHPDKYPWPEEYANNTMQAVVHTRSVMVRNKQTQIHVDICHALIIGEVMAPYESGFLSF